MNKTLPLLLAIIAGQAVAMESMELTIDAQHNRQDTTVEQKVVILNEGQKREVPTHYCALSATLKNLVEDLAEFLEEGIPLPKVTLATWQHIQPQLERVYKNSQGDTQSKGEIIADYRELSNMSLIDLLKAVEYLDIPLLQEITLKLAQDKFTFDEILELPRYLRNELVKREVLPIYVIRSVRGPREHMQSHFAFNSVYIIRPEKKAILGSHNQVLLFDFVDMRVSAGSSQIIVNLVFRVAFNGHEGPVRSVCATEGRIVSGADDKTVRIWDMNGKELAVGRGHEGPVSSVCVTPDGKRIVSGSEDGTVRIWDMNGHELFVCRGHEGPVSSVCATEGRIVSGSDDTTVRFWDRDGQELAVGRGHVGKVSCICVTTDGKIVSGSWDGSLSIWDMNGKELGIFLRRNRNEDETVVSVCVKNDNRIVSAYKDGSITIWDMNGQELGYCWEGYDKAGGNLDIKSICVAPDGSIFSASRGFSGKLPAYVDTWDDGLLDPMLNDLSDMNRKQAELLLMRKEWTESLRESAMNRKLEEVLLMRKESFIEQVFPSDKESLREKVWPSHKVEKARACLYEHFWKESAKILKKEELVEEPKKRKVLESSDSNPAKKVRFEEVVTSENK